MIFLRTAKSLAAQTVFDCFLNILKMESEIECNILSPVLTAYLPIIINRSTYSIVQILVGESQTRDEQISFIVSASASKDAIRAYEVGIVIVVRAGSLIYISQ